MQFPSAGSECSLLQIPVLLRASNALLYLEPLYGDHTIDRERGNITFGFGYPFSFSFYTSHTHRKMDETQPLLPNGQVPGTRTNGTLTEGTSQDNNTDLERILTNSDSDPQNWTTSYKWGITCLLAFTAFTVTFTCISVVPIASSIVADLDSHSGRHSSAGSAASVLLVTIWELGEAAGPLLIAPLSEIYGRYPVYNAANGLFIVSIALAALSQSTTLLIAARFMTGCAVASNVLNPAIIGDMFPTEQRGSAMSLVMLAPLVGGAIGPAIAGAVAQTVGWRKVMWMSFALSCFYGITFLCLFRETYRPAILRKAAMKMRLDPEAVKTAGEEGGEDGVVGASAKSPILASITRPARILWSSIVLQMLSLYGAVTFAFFYVLSTTLPDILQSRYGFPPALVGTSFLTFSKLLLKPTPPLQPPR